MCSFGINRKHELFIFSRNEKPIYDADLRKFIINLIEVQLNDNVKARLIDKNSRNRYVVRESGIPVQSQLETYYFLKRQQDQFEAKMDHDNV